MQKVIAWLLPLAVFLLLVGCSTKVERMETGEVKDLSGRWNDSVWMRKGSRSVWSALPRLAPITQPKSFTSSGRWESTSTGASTGFCVARCGACRTTCRR